MYKIQIQLKMFFIFDNIS